MMFLCVGVIGAWAYEKSQMQELADFFENAHPFPHVVIDNFFSPELADRIELNFPTPKGTCNEWKQDGWHVYDNPMEGKLIYNLHDNSEMLSKYDRVFPHVWSALQSDAFVDKMKVCPESGVERGRGRKRAGILCVALMRLK
jgi:hypothetical protein